MIVVAWLVSGAIGSPIALGLNYTPDRVPDQCLFNSRDYVIFSSLGSFYIPCVIMCALYFRIFTVSLWLGVNSKYRFCDNCMLLLSVSVNLAFTQIMYLSKCYAVNKCASLKITS